MSEQEQPKLLSQNELTAIRMAFNVAAAHNEDTMSAGEALGQLFRKIVTVNPNHNQTNELAAENEKLKAKVAELFAEIERVNQENQDLGKKLMAAKSGLTTEE